MNVITEINRALKKASDLLKKPIFLNFLLITGVTLLAKGLGFFKETLIAGEFGLSLFLDSFILAVLIPSFIQTVFIGALRNIFIPNYIAELSSTRKIGEFQTVGFLSVLLIVVVLIFFAFLFSILFLDIVFPGRTAEFYELVRKQLYVLLPCIIFWGFSSILGGLLEVEKKFWYSSLSSLFLPIATIVCLHYFKSYLQDYVLAVGLLSGSFFSFCYLLVGVIRFKLLKIKRPKRNQNVTNMLQQLPPKISSGLLTGMNGYVDQFFAAQLAAGSISAIAYGAKIPAFLVGITMLSLGKVLLPHFSEIIQNDLKRAFKQLFRMLKLIFFIGFCIAIVIFLFSEDIVSLLFERKEFGSEDVQIVAKLQRILLVYLPFYLCTQVMVKFLTSFNKNKFMAWVSFAALFMNFIFNYLFISRFGLYGLVLSTTVVYILNSLIFFTYTYRKYKILF